MELEFWRGMIHQYLYPLENNKNQQKKVKEELLDLRNESTFAFFMLNAIFVSIVFTLTILQEGSNLSVQWPCFDNSDKEYIDVEPIGLVFLVFFGVIMIIQFVGMVFHRLGTLYHVIATTRLGCGKKSQQELIHDNVEGAIELAKRLQMLQGVDEEDRKSIISFSGESDDMETEYVEFEKKKSVFRLAKKQATTVTKPQRTKTLNAAFAKRFVALRNQLDEKDPNDICESLDGQSREMNMKSRQKSVKALHTLQEQKHAIFDEDRIQSVMDQAQTSQNTVNPRLGRKLRFKEDTNVRPSVIPEEIEKDDNCPGTDRVTIGMKQTPGEDSISRHSDTRSLIQETKDSRVSMHSTHSGNKGPIIKRSSLKEVGGEKKHRHLRYSVSLDSLMIQGKASENASSKTSTDRIRSARKASTERGFIRKPSEISMASIGESIGSAWSVTSRSPRSNFEFDWAQSRERAESNLSAIKLLINMADNTLPVEKESDSHETSKL